VTLLWQRGWTRWSPEVLSNPYHSVTLCPTEAGMGALHQTQNCPQILLKLFSAFTLGRNLRRGKGQNFADFLVHTDLSWYTANWLNQMTWWPYNHITKGTSFWHLSKLLVSEVERSFQNTAFLLLFSLYKSLLCFVSVLPLHDNIWAFRCWPTSEDKELHKIRKKVLVCNRLLLRCIHCRL